MPSVFEAVKAAVPMRAAAERFGLEVNYAGMVRCPFRDDHTPSMKLYDDHFYCFGCGRHGDVVDLTAELFCIPPYDAACKLADDFGIHYTLEEICEDLSCGHNKAVRLMAELDGNDGIGLIDRKKQGQGKPTKIYVKRFTTSQTSENQKSRLPENGNQDFPKSEVKTSRKRKSRLPKIGM